VRLHPATGAGHRQRFAIWDRALLPPSSPPVPPEPAGPPEPAAAPDAPCGLSGPAPHRTVPDQRCSTCRVRPPSCAARTPDPPGAACPGGRTPDSGLHHVAGRRLAHPVTAARTHTHISRPASSAASSRARIQARHDIPTIAHMCHRTVLHGSPASAGQEAERSDGRGSPFRLAAPPDCCTPQDWPPVRGGTATRLQVRRPRCG
jgi:hypothetical protein